MAAALAPQQLGPRQGASCRWRQRPSRPPSPLLPHPRLSSQPGRPGCRAQLQPNPAVPGGNAASAAGASAAGVTAAPPAPPPPAPPLDAVLARGGGDGGSGPAPPQQPDEPELALILVACGVGLATGACIVGFNWAVHWIHDVVWQEQELLTSNAAARLREITETDLWPKVVFPPLLGGLAVGSLGWLIGGYDDAPKPKLAGAAGGGERGAAAGASGSQQQQQQQGAAGGVAGEGAGAGASTSAAWAHRRVQAGAVVRPVSRAMAAAMTLGSGASLGPEGPSVDIGKSVAAGLGSSLRSRQRHLTSLIAAGSGAGVAAGFNAPIAGVFFAVETVLQRQKLPRIGIGGEAAQAQAAAAQQQQQASGLTIAMVLLASVLAAIVSQAGLGSSPAFRVPEYRQAAADGRLALAAFCRELSGAYPAYRRHPCLACPHTPNGPHRAPRHTAHSQTPAHKHRHTCYPPLPCSHTHTTWRHSPAEAFDELREQNSFEAALTPAMGGLTTGLLALGYPEILYQGFDNVNNILSSNGSYAPGLLIQIVVMKVIATAICRGSGLQGGLYAPSIFIGAALGTAFGLLAHAVGDPIGLPLSAPQAYALVGVAALLASNCQVPLTSVLLLFELTRDYLIILPTLAAVGISFWVSSLVAPSVKNAAAARRMTAAAAASAAVATTQLNAAATEAVLVGSLKDKLGALPAASSPAAAAAAAAAAASTPPLPGQSSGGGDGTATVTLQPGELPGHAELAAAAALSGTTLSVGSALERSCLLVEAHMPVPRALELMEADGQHVAVVLGEDGGVLGLVTREILEQCVEAAEDALSSADISGTDSDGGGGPGGGPGGRRSRRRGGGVAAGAATDAGTGAAPAGSAALSSRGEE
ncbi:hypothetical protein CHLNCDRAFT_56435 [Chlorella variabilis]|uniref:CBS domain-containing protein n=1 Tax=Chlorella variabilis TaxID=554065 RepID=E1Z1X9_CHLVA|nr:hypothetical protein CHLNCDRAFT_56435 [Chlorella variabilis]EFN59895.1 hypothetical protein CHLNCDRAFT_56435 [Chlorella variabilis]|eukprot:XP_005851997.1 hypothetical protein CHLNCDRAFT_56435 [Chlorella variabilis]